MTAFSQAKPPNPALKRTAAPPLSSTVWHTTFAEKWMQTMFIAAGVIALITGIVHSALGEILIFSATPHWWACSDNGGTAAT